MSEPVQKKLTAEISTFGSTGSGSGVACDLTSLSGFSAHYDEPEALGGSNSGQNPMELLGNALVSCQQVMVTVVAGELGISVKRIDWSVSVDIDIRGLGGQKDIPVEPQRVTVIAKIVLPQSQHERLEELQKAVEGRCPVFTLYKKAGVQVENDWKAIVE